MNQSYSKEYERVSKARARKLYDAGVTIRILPVNVYPENDMFALDINKNDEFEVEPFEWEIKFDSRVNRFDFYNCNYNETGKYSAFYIRKEG